MSKLSLKENPTIADFQRYVADMKTERGFNQTDVIYDCLLLNEEVGELCKAIRKYKGKRIDANSSVGAVSEELADIFIYICSIANITGVDLEKAFRDKEEVNKKRTWA